MCRWEGDLGMRETGGRIQEKEKRQEMQYIHVLIWTVFGICPKHTVLKRGKCKTGGQGGAGGVKESNNDQCCIQAWTCQNRTR